MPSIIGSSHKDYVKDQIKTRQEILGKSSRTSEDITWMNGRTSWIRLASSVDIKDSNILFYNTSSEQYEEISNNGSELRQEYLGLSNYEGNTLSKQLVLQGGILNENQTQKFGISTTTSDLPGLTDNYGFGGNEFGPKPMPGITSFDVKTNNKGSLRFATIGIIAHNKRQFEYLETIYLRLGYTVLLEWGNSTYPINENSNIEYRQNRANLSQEFLNTSLEGQASTTYFYTEIDRLKKQTQGNYDGFLGRIQNFSWQFTKEGTYQITLELVTIGSVLESLKLNVTYNDFLLDKEGELLPSTELDNSLLNFLKVITSPKNNPEISGKPELEVNFGWLGMATSYITNIGVENPKTFLEFTPIEKDKNTNIVEVCRATFGKTSDLYNYIRFGKLLDIINKHFLVLDKSSNPAFIELDTSNDQYCFSNKLAVSSEPSKVIIRNKIEDKTYGTFEIFDNEESQIEIFHDEIEGVNIGRIMNIYLSYQYLESLIKDLQENTGENVNLSVYNFLKKLLEKVNSVLGGLNKLNLRIVNKEFILTKDDGEESTTITKQVIEFYDEVSPFEIEKLRNTKEDDPVFSIYGFNGNQGSFVTDYNFQTNISKNTSTMIAVGAQANGEAVGEDATLFSKWSLGLVDRILPNKLDSNSVIKSQDRVSRGYYKLIRSYSKYLRLFSKSTSTNVSKIITPGESTIIGGPTIGTGTQIKQNEKTIEYKGYGFPNCHLSSVKGQRSISGFDSVQKSFFRKFYTLEAISEKSSTPFIGFIPINLSLTFDGLSGIRIFDKLKVDSRFLPPNYNNTLDFIITGLNHKINNNKWETSVDTLSIPKSITPLNLNIQTLVKDFPPITTGAESFVGYYKYEFSALATMLKQTIKIKEGDNITLNNNGLFTLPNEFLNSSGGRRLGNEYKNSPLISIGKISGNTTANASFVLRNATTATGIDSVSTKAFKLLNQNTNKVYYDGNYYLAEPAAEALLEFGKFLEKEYPGKTYLITSAYRNIAHQKGLSSNDKSNIAAKPGGSPHGWGGAIDIQELTTHDPSKLNEFGNPSLTSNPTLNSLTRETNLNYEIWAEHAPKFGWYNPYRLSDGQSSDESWHWEFWGKPGSTIKSQTPDGKAKFGIDKKSEIRVPTLKESSTLAIGKAQLYKDSQTGKPTKIKPKNE